VTRDIWLIVAAVLLFVVAFLLAMLEAAHSRLSRVRTDEMVREGRRSAPQLAHIVADPARYLNVLLLLRTTCELVAAVLVVAVFVDRVQPRWQALLLAALVLVVVSYVAIGVSPRTLGRQHADAVALASASFVVGVTRVLGPLPKLLILLGNAVTPGRGFREGPFATEAELRDLVDLAQESKLIQAEERAMIHSVFELGDTIVREVMVPRTDMVFIERTKTLRQALSLALRSGFSRIPVVGDGLDDVLGIVYLKDVTRRTHEYHEAESTERVESVMRPATFVPESKPLDALLREMQRDQIHIAVVVDEYGGTAGIVTIEDVIEEIVGEIADEYDNETAPVEQLANGAVRVSARLPVDELGELFGAEIDDPDVDTVGGLLAKHLGRVPIPGAQVEAHGLLLTAESTAGRRNRIGTVLVTRASGQNGATRYDPDAAISEVDA
jgi:CBS domain containing-hemolysin-like protein